MTAQLVGSNLFVMAGVLALVGWVLPLRDGIRRFTFRFLACGLMAATFCIWFGADHALWQKGANLVFAWWMIARTGHWWRAVELLRKLRDEIAAHKARGRAS